MTPKKKAIELVDKFHIEVLDRDGTSAMNEFEAKQCALIAVDDILESEPRYPSNVDWDDAGGTFQFYYEAQREEAQRYWEEVKQEIKKL